YVFFFLGDGMASSQIQATEAYLTTLNGGSATVAADLLNPENRLNMSKMRVQGMQTTYDAGALMTDSASAGTAFACGAKTKSGTIGMDETLTTELKSIAQLAHEQGKKVGIISSVSLDHATPASYYASVTSRGYMNNIATQLAESGYEFFGGGGLVAPTGPARDGDTGENVWDLLTKNGYTVLNDRGAILDLMDNPKDKVVCINPVLPGSAAMPYAIDKPDKNLSLAEMTEVAIENLYRDRRGRGRHRDRGFFLMVEGGKIDWACHANDAVAAIGDMIDFDDAIGVALEFMRQHPLQTLVVVTGDHETGGMTIGHATTAYTAYYDRLMGQTNSYEHFGMNEWLAHKDKYSDTYQHASPNNFLENGMDGLVLSFFGLSYDDLNDYQKEQLERAYDWSMTRVYDPVSKKWIDGSHADEADKNNLLYGNYEPIIVTITHILNERASIGWTSYSHTGVPVPVFAEGREAFRFAGFYDNTDIAKKLARAMGIRAELPVTKY
ncbi:MAG: alkaline phosphatase, partial [Desulfobacteraceae bacterium]|nr:alkaline phosphatase [Desulfobacteraceae bacterium]